ncbi:MAG: MFS transporter [Phycisphaerales bacterium]|nr:MFS transporter [Phycisphaerales bacterium]
MPLGPQVKTNELPRRGFAALLVTMSCGAFNDNLLRGALLIAVPVGGGGMWEGQLGEGGTGWVTAMLYAPFILLLGVTGQIADRWPRQRVILVSRVLEVLLTGMVIWAFAVGSLVLACLSLVCMAAQSALFSPAKYGIVPDLVEDRHLSRANGVLSMLTNVMILVGVAASGYLLQDGGFWIGFVMLALALIGLVASLAIPRGRAWKPDLKMSPRTFSTHLRTIRAMQGTPLIVATLAWCWFYGIGSLIISIVPNYKGPMNLTNESASILLAAPGVGIAIGGIAAGLGSGDRIRGQLVPLGAALMTVGFVLLGLLDASFTGLWALLCYTGIAAGFFVIPVMALLQHLPETSFRARCVSTSNFCTYLAMSITAVLFAVVAPATGSDPALWFLICAGLMLVVTLWTFKRRDTLRLAGLPDQARSVCSHD